MGHEPYNLGDNLTSLAYSHGRILNQQCLRSMLIHTPDPVKWNKASRCRTFNSGTYSNDVTDLSPDGNWHHTSSDLLPFAGQTATTLGIGPGVPTTPVGPYDAWVANIVIQSLDGTVHPLFTGGAATGTVWGTCGNTNLTFAVEATPVDPLTGTTFYVGDHLGTAQMELSSAGAPIWQGAFAPFGEELDSQMTANRYKFTGKERDTESGLDYFGARYYGSNMGRFMSPDWSSSPEAVPYVKLSNPQTLNLYAYAGNNPLRRADPNGHFWKELGNWLEWGTWTRDTAYAKHVFYNSVAIEQARKQQAAANHQPQYRVSMQIVYPTGGLGIAAEAGVAAEAVEAVDAANAAEGATAAAETGEAAAATGESTTLQSGGNSLSNQTAKGLNEGTGENLTKRDWGRALEDLKKDNGLSNDTHGKIMSNGDYSVNGNVIGNITHYIP